MRMRIAWAGRPSGKRCGTLEGPATNLIRLNERVRVCEAKDEVRFLHLQPKEVPIKPTYLQMGELRLRAVTCSRSHGMQ